jgi:L-rhamnose isomerase
VDVSHHRFPHCLELIDLEQKVRDFWKTHGKEMKTVRAVFLPCETAGIDG